MQGGFVVDGDELEDFKFALAVGGDDGGHVADFFADKSPPDGRGGGDEALGDVGFFAGDEAVFGFDVLVDVEDGDA